MKPSHDPGFCEPGNYQASGVLPRCYRWSDIWGLSGCSMEGIQTIRAHSNVCFRSPALLHWWGVQTWWRAYGNAIGIDQTQRRTVCWLSCDQSLTSKNNVQYQVPSHITNMQQDGWILLNNEICIVPARHFAKTYLEILAELHGSIPWSGESPSKNKTHLASIYIWYSLHLPQPIVCRMYLKCQIAFVSWPTMKNYMLSCFLCSVMTSLVIDQSSITNI